MASSLTLAAQCASAYNLAQEFSISNNPNGAWSYGYEASLDASFNLLSVAIVNENNVPGWNHWRTAADAFLGVYKNSGATNIVGGGSLVPVGAVILHPGGSGELATVRWSAPGPGFWRVFGSFTGNDLTTTDVHIRLGSQAILDTTVSGFGNTNSFDFTINTLASDTLDFIVGDGGNGNGHDSTGLSVTLVNAAKLTIERQGDNVILRWPAAAANFILEFNSSTALPDGWLRASETPEPDGSFMKVTRPIGSTPEIFRLRYEEQFPS